MKKIAIFALVAGIFALSLAGCADMRGRDYGTIVGAGAGAAVGSGLGGGVLGSAAGAVGGAVVGHYAGKGLEKSHK
ncbi:MAG: hypothetical protein A2X78_05395 [Gammaproteobacteria bacterium GWE2_37_16]|nr:MAG: hypothetical protein A2X78_05395 [Gammaproteobacteria bacterium GWE2_37_16]